MPLSFLHKAKIVQQKIAQCLKQIKMYILYKSQKIETF